jgi:hypothetical protein
MRRILTTPLALMAMASAAHATPFASGKLYGGPSQIFVVCYILNTSTKSVSLSPVTIADEAGTATSVDTTCGSTLAAHMGCATSNSTVISTTKGYDCSTEVSLVTGLRGSIEIRSNSGVLQTQPMR